MMRLCFGGLVVLSAALWVSPDVVPPFGGNRSHYVDHSIVISNRVFTGDTVLVVSDVGGRASVVDTSAMFGSFVKLIAVSRSSLENAGGVASLRNHAIANLPDSSSASIGSMGYYRIDNAYSLVSETFYYEVTGIAGGKAQLRLASRILGYNDGGADEIITY